MKFAARTVKTPICRALACLMLAGFLALTGAAPVMAQRTQGIAVLVNDDPISDYDVQQRIRLLTVTTRQRDKKRLRNKAIDELIEEKLIRQEAKRMNVEVSPEAVQAQLKTMAQRSRLTLPQFKQALRGVGINVNAFTQRIETQMAWPQVIRKRFGGTIQIRPEDVDNALENLDGPKISSRYEYILQGILFIVPEGASEATVRERRNLAERLHNRFRSCSQTKAQVAGFPDVVINDLGRHSSDNMSPAERQRFAKVDVNQTTPPRREDTGFELIAVCAKNEIKDEKLARRTAEIKLLNKEFEVMARRHLLDLKRDAVIERR